MPGELVCTPQSLVDLEGFVNPQGLVPGDQRLQPLFDPQDQTGPEQPLQPLRIGIARRLADRPLLRQAKAQIPAAFVDFRTVIARRHGAQDLQLIADAQKVGVGNLGRLQVGICRKLVIRHGGFG